MLSQEGPCCHTSMLIMTVITTDSFPTESDEIGKERRGETTSNTISHRWSFPTYGHGERFSAADIYHCHRCGGVLVIAHQVGSIPRPSHAPERIGFDNQQFLTVRFGYHDTFPGGVGEAGTVRREHRTGYTTPDPSGAHWEVQSMVTVHLHGDDSFRVNPADPGAVSGPHWTAGFTYGQNPRVVAVTVGDHETRRIGVQVYVSHMLTIRR